MPPTPKMRPIDRAARARRAQKPGPSFLGGLLTGVVLTVMAIALADMAGADLCAAIGQPSDGGGWPVKGR